MIRLKTLLIAFAFLFAVSCDDPVLAQEANPPDPVGAWTGKLEIPGNALTVVVYVSKGDDGALSGELESPDQNPGQRLPMNRLSVENGHMAWDIQNIQASFKGDWNEAGQDWEGEFSQGGGTLPLKLARGEPPARPVVEGLDGVWEGTIELNGASLRQQLTVKTGEHGTAATFNAPDQRMFGLGVPNLARSGQAVSFSVLGGIYAFEGTLSDNGTSLAGQIDASAIKQVFPVTFTRTQGTGEVAAPRRPQRPQPPFPYRQEDVGFDNPDWPGVHLAGTLTIPQGEGPFPAAILLSGSGPQDRNGTVFDHQIFAVIADYLTRRGIAVLRVDDRGVGESTGTYDTATSVDLATDANAAFAELRRHEEVDAKAIGFIGISEGGMIGPIAMTTNPDVAYMVLLAAPGVDFVHIGISQARLQGAAAGASKEQLDKREKVVKAMLLAYTGAPTLEEAVKAVGDVLTPEALETLGAPGDTGKQAILAELANPANYFRDRYDPRANLERITVPILAMGGSRDLQVYSAENLPGIAEATKENPDVTIVRMPGLNHLFQHARTGSVGEYGSIEETFAPEALKLIGDWIDARFGKH